MRRNKKPHPIIEKQTVTSIAAEGKAIVRYNDKVIFVPFVVPGDVVDLQITKKKSKYMEARAIHFHEYSSVRETAFCEHYGICGGCKWQILPYAEQIRYKQQQVIDALTRIGKIEMPIPHPILGASNTTFYRNKLEFTFSNKRWMTFEEMDAEEKGTMNALGFHIPGLFDKVLDINKCWLQDDISNKIRLAVRAYALDNNLTFFDLRSQEGFLRNLIIRTSSIGEIMVIVVFYYEDKYLQDSLLQHLSDTFPQITSLL
ncbi:MAG: class I SAM-dependent RNA methyltransferase, partial [Paludibacteraceae bacterium]|nr:class I SAM-dependent RNA methyltransferase [Paludibacteraceae bacterium]